MSFELMISPRALTFKRDVPRPDRYPDTTMANRRALRLHLDNVLTAPKHSPT
jgi:hypothetical protein